MTTHFKPSPIWAQPQLGTEATDTAATDPDASAALRSRRAQARANLEDGAVTAQYGEHRLQVLALLDSALATELVCMLRYRRHHFMARGAQVRTIGHEFLVHAAQEQRHADWLAERIAQLGGEPDFAPDSLLKRSHAQYVEGDSLEEMVREDLVAERIAIDSYRSFIKFLGTQDPTTRRLLETILAAEEGHADELASMLHGMPSDRSEAGDTVPSLRL